MRADLETLVTYLLTLGGQAVVDHRLEADFADPDFVRRLRSEGVIVAGEAATLIPGRPSRCHENAEDYARLRPQSVWWTGMALSDDGLWRSHSWVVTGHRRLLETTEPRVLYLGLPAALDRSLIEDGSFTPAEARRIARRTGFRLAT